MLQLKIKTPPLKKTSIECHNEALQAFKLTKDLIYQYKQLNFSSETVYWLQMFDPIHAIEVSRNEFKFFAGWYWLPVCRNTNIKKITIIVHTEIKQSEIQRAAWAYLLGNQFKSLHRRNNLSQMVHYLDTMPAHIKKNLLGLYGTSSSQKIVQRLSNESRSAIRNQNKYLKSSEKRISPIPSIREQLIKGGK